VQLSRRNRTGKETVLPDFYAGIIAALSEIAFKKSRGGA